MKKSIIVFVENITLSYLCLCVRYKARIRGMFHAITVPTAVSRIITEGNYQEKLFNCKNFVKQCSQM